jgi:hypothetical protein
VLHNDHVNQGGSLLFTGDTMNTRIFAMIFSVAVISACTGSDWDEIIDTDGSGCDGSASDVCESSGEVDLPEEPEVEDIEEDIEEEPEVEDIEEDIGEGKTALEEFIAGCYEPEILIPVENFDCDGNKCIDDGNGTCHSYGCSVVRNDDRSFYEIFSCDQIDQ